MSVCLGIMGCWRPWSEGGSEGIKATQQTGSEAASARTQYGIGGTERVNSRHESSRMGLHTVSVCVCVCMYV